MFAQSLIQNKLLLHSNDGSAKNEVGKFIVQSFLINGKQLALPTMPVFTESVHTLKELEILTLNILSHASGNKYSALEIVGRIDFVMTDSTAHNKGVIEEVCKELGRVCSFFLSLQCASTHDVAEEN